MSWTMLPILVLLRRLSSGWTHLQKYDGLSYAVGGGMFLMRFLSLVSPRSIRRSVVSTMCSLLILYSVSGIGIPSFYSLVTAITAEWSHDSLGSGRVDAMDPSALLVQMAAFHLPIIGLPEFAKADGSSTKYVPAHGL
jgi:hypothetical protein